VNPPGVKYWEIIADNLKKAGWSWGCVSALDAHGRTIWIADAHRDDRKRFVVRAEKCWGRLLNHSGTLRGLMIIPREFFFCTKVIVKENVAAFVVIAFPENNFRGAVIIVVSCIH